jgi:hypothetical protein
VLAAWSAKRHQGGDSNGMQRRSGVAGASTGGTVMAYIIQQNDKLWDRNGVLALGGVPCRANIRARALVGVSIDRRAWFRNVNHLWRRVYGMLRRACMRRRSDSGAAY